MQQKETPNTLVFTVPEQIPASGRIVAVDPGTKRIGVAISDKDRIVATPLSMIERKSWKRLLLEIKGILAEFDAVALVVGLPYNFDGSESEMTLLAREMARKFSLSLGVPVYLQDERATTYEARGRLWRAGLDGARLKATVDSEAASIILTDFLDRLRAFESGQ